MIRLIVVFLLGHLALDNATAGIRSYTEFTLKNGLAVLAVPEPSLPYFALTLMIKTGSAADPKGLSGIGSAVSELLERGTQTKSATQIADSFGQIASDFSSHVSQDSTILGASTLSPHADTLLKLFSEVLLTPRFQEDEVVRWKREQMAGLAQISDDPNQLSSIAFEKLLFGSHPYGRSPSGSMAEVRLINRTSIIRHYFKYYRPRNAILVVTGQLPSDLQPRLEAALGNWQDKPVTDEAMSELANTEGVRVRLVHKADLTQAYVRIGHVGIRRNITDYLNMRVANFVLGGGFTSRLMDEIRDNAGLTYGIYSGFSAGQVEGSFLIHSFTRNDKVGELISKSIGILKAFADKGVTSAELSDAKGYMAGEFPRLVETAGELAQNLLSLRLYGVGDEYLKDFVKNLRAVDAKELNASIRKRFHPESLLILVFANKDAVLEQLKAFGPVEVLDYKSFQ